MPIILLICFIIMCAVLLVLYLFNLADETPNRNPILVICASVIAIFSTWIFISLQQPYIIEHEYTADIKTVVYPDGSSEQMYMYEGRPCSATQRFNKIIDEKEYQVKIVIPKKIYYGIAYDGNKYTDQFLLIKKSK